MIILSNYKLEVENTEKLKSDISSAFTDINTELKKDDDLIAEDLFDVDRCIEELKKTRKKWASGGALAVMKDYDKDVIYTKLPKLNFSPKVYILSTKVYDTDNITNVTINIDSVFKFRHLPAYYNSRSITRGVTGIGDKWDSYTREQNYKVATIDAYNSNNIVLTFNDDGVSPSTYNVKVNKWIAFE